MNSKQLENTLDGTPTVQNTSIARLEQTIRDANAYIGDEPNAENKQPATNPSDALSESDDSSSSDSDLDVDSDSDMDDQQRDLLQIMDEDEDDEPVSTVIKTRNEVVNPEVPAPPISQLPDTAELCCLGAVHSIVDSSVIIQANSSGEVHVLDSDSLIAFDDRKVLGVVFDIFGPVTRPMYTVRFSQAEDIDLAACVVGRPVFYAPGWARMLSTNKLRVKGTDASNEYDEEVAEDAMEFSDDEAEVAFKRQKKREQARRFREPRVPPGPKQTSNDSEPAKSAENEVASSSVAGRKLQSYEDMYDPEYGF
ncbi:hypothetical protein LPJ78_003013 [Coemansia sp. RSA 989]|nr:Gar1/Naf1 RNA binding region-domain-containing protein [Coemansia mojavensis]KAJ1750371.1 hypothetical protein LPJ79_002949 [Coemansia sp. RSA 1821]KAJ1864964.1 hypothetical protein LPJ78_003013 [Coemansia sp. RSA 989]KAJ1872384.1 hypothetical protein LPJ55_003153 [Coemansia sp. RSA 990]KAJ2671679.1 hypothetical protein IWW42_003290 [Coemansia sp. RSA 1085]